MPVLVVYNTDVITEQRIRIRRRPSASYCAITYSATTLEQVRAAAVDSSARFRPTTTPHSRKGFALAFSRAKSHRWKLDRHTSKTVSEIPLG